MTFYRIDDRDILQKTKQIINDTYAWQGDLVRFAKILGFDRIVLKGDNDFHQYAVAELAIHESKRLGVDTDAYDFVDTITISHNNPDFDLLSGVYYIYQPKPKTALAKMILNGLLDIGITTPKRDLLALLCSEPHKITKVYRNFDWVDGVKQETVIYCTIETIEENYDYCESLGDTLSSEIKLTVNELHKFRESVAKVSDTYFEAATVA